jgi:hypothetical protein
MPSRPLLSGLAWRAAMIATTVILLIAIVYAIAQLISVLNTGIAFS